MMEGKKIQKGMFILVFLMIPLFLGMGSSGSGSPDKIPVPAKKFKVVVVDQMDVVTEAQDASIDGATFVEGKRGEGIFTVAFENISSVVFFRKEGILTGNLKLRDGASQTLILQGNKRLFGRTAYGTFQIPLSELKKMTVNGR
jgi:hypothetical protein